MCQWCCCTPALIIMNPATLLPPWALVKAWLLAEDHAETDEEYNLDDEDEESGDDVNMADLEVVPEPERFQV